MKSIFVYILLTVSLFSFAVFANNKVAPNFDLTDLNGKQVKLSDYKGKVVFLNFWATWCPPCKKEIPDFIELQKKYSNQGFTFIGIALDDYQSVVRFVKDNKINYPVVIGDEALVKQYGNIRGIPTSFLVGKDGKIAQRYEGFRTKEVFEKDIKFQILK